MEIRPATSCGISVASRLSVAPNAPAGESPPTTATKNRTMARTARGHRRERDGEAEGAL